MGAREHRPHVGDDAMTCLCDAKTHTQRASRPCQMDGDLFRHKERVGSFPNLAHALLRTPLEW